MNILAVDTAGKTAGVALLQDDRLLYEVYLDAGMTHSETLMPMIDTCLKMCGMTCADIDLYGVNAGPGSFTGLRIGLAAVKGLAFPRETLCAPVSTLEALAAAHTGEGTVLCALDARRAQVYSAAFDLATHARLLDDDARAVSDWPNGSAPSALPPKPPQTNRRPERPAPKRKECNPWQNPLHWPLTTADLN